MNIKNTILMLFLVSLTACVNNRLPEVDVIEIPVDELNAKISLTAPDGWNNFKIGDAITYTIINISDEKIVFDPNYGARIFVYDEGTWTETSNKLINLNSNDVILEPIKDNPTATGTTSILPKLESQARSLTIRVYVIGYLYKDNIKSDDMTGAFIDVVLRK
jgi:hypothetical protein